MALFNRRTRELDLEILTRELKTALGRIEDQDRIIAQQTADVWNAQQEAKAASRPIPANLSDLAEGVRAYVPSVTGAPGYTALKRATTIPEYAAAIHSLLLTAQAAGYRQAQEERR